MIGGVEQKAHFFAFDLPHSDACYVRAYPAATAEAWADGHVQAFAFFGRVPLSVLYDNDRCLVARILPDGTRERAALFSALLSHYVIEDRYGRPGKGTDKGSVEGIVGWSRRNFMVPLPRFATWDDFNDETLSAIGPRTMVECWRSSAASGSGRSCAATARVSQWNANGPRDIGEPASGSSGISRRWRRCRRRRSRPATRRRAGSARRRWCATGPMTTRCRSPTATAMSGSGALSTGSSSAAAARSSPAIRGATAARTWSSIRSTACHSSRRRSAPSTRRRPWRAGSRRPSSRPCAG